MRQFEPVQAATNAETNRRLALNSLFAIALVVLFLGWGWLMRQQAINAAIPYEDEINGIRANIPANWLLSEGVDGTVFRVQNPEARPFKTTIQISVQTVGEDATPRNVVDLLKLQGPLKLSGYRALAEQDIRLGEDEAVRIDYSYVSQELNPFLEALPVVIQGVDVVVLRGNQAVIITFRDAASTFNNNYFYFRSFLNSLEY
jgi:hypothetical protein